MAAVEVADAGMQGNQGSQRVLHLGRQLAAMTVRMQLRDPAPVRVLEFLQAAVRSQVELRIDVGQVRLHGLP